MSETTLTTGLRRMLEAAGAYVEKNHGSSVETAGRPDLSGCLRGAYFGFEIKKPKRQGGREPTKLQLWVMEAIRRAGGYAGTITSREQLADILRRWPLVCKHCLGQLLAKWEDGPMTCVDCGQPWQ